MKRNKIPRILLAMLISVFLWLYIVTVVDPNDTKVVYSVPVTYENMTLSLIHISTPSPGLWPPWGPRSRRWAGLSSSHQTF